MDIALVDLVVPAIVAALIVGVRQFSEKLDGPAAYWWSIVVNIVSQVVVELASGGTGTIVGAAALGLGTGAVVSPGLAISAKRLGASEIVTPRPEPEWR